jgi:iron complex transport system ATP-binding protein
MSEATAITFNRTEFRYGHDAWNLQIPELHFGAQHFTGIVGPNGSGKSTLLRLAAGLLTPSAGTVTLDREPLTKLTRRMIARKIGFLPQETPPLFDYSVEDVVRMGRYIHAGWFGESDREGDQAVEEALEAVGVLPVRTRPLSQLSGGERRRSLIAAVLAQRPRLLLLDEPTSALDLHHAIAVMRLLATLGRSGRAAVVIVTHDLNLASLFADRLLMIFKGRILADGTPQEVLTQEVLSTAYGKDVLVQRHPVTGGPLIVAQQGDLQAERFYEN